MAVRRNAWIAFLAVCVIWGTTYLAIKVALETIPPFLLGGVRYVIAGLVLMAVQAGRGAPFPPRRDWARLAGLGFLMITLGNGGVNWGEQYLASGLTAVMIATSPFWMVTVDALFADGAPLTGRHAFGLGIGLVGIVVLVWPDITLDGATGTTALLGILALQIACCGWSIASSYTKRHGFTHSVLSVAAVQMLFGGLFMLAIGTAQGEWADWSLTPRTTSALVYLTIFGSIIAFAAYSYALRHLPIATVSLYTYVNPVIAVVLGIVLLDEPFRFSMLTATAIIAIGIWTVRSQSRSAIARPR